MRKRSGNTITLDFPVETPEREIIFKVEATVAPYTPARLYGKPEDCYPEEGGEIEDLTLQLQGHEISIDKATQMGLNMQQLEERIYELAGEDDGCDENDCEEPDYAD